MAYNEVDRDLLMRIEQNGVMFNITLPYRYLQTYSKTTRMVAVAASGVQGRNLTESKYKSIKITTNMQLKPNGIVIIKGGRNGNNLRIPYENITTIKLKRKGFDLYVNTLLFEFRFNLLMRIGIRRSTPVSPKYLCELICRYIMDKSKH